MYNNYGWKNEINKNVMLYPNENIVSFLAREFKDLDDNFNKKALDIGFGSGRHIKLLMDYNFNVSGIEYEKRCEEVMREVIQDCKKLDKIYIGDVNNCIIKEKFDVIINFGLAFLNGQDFTEKNMRICYELLNENGKMLVNFRSEYDFLKKLGTNIGRNSYVIGKEGKEYEGMHYSFYSEELAKEILENTGFKILKCERVDYYKGIDKNQNSWYIFEVQKI